MRILDFIATKPVSLGHFRPASPEDLIGLRLAQKLEEPGTAAHYAQLAAQHSSDRISAAYRRVVNGTRPVDAAHRFHVELDLAGGHGNIRADERLLAIKIERRAIAIAVFVGNRLDFHDTRNLSSQANKAEASAAGFLSWVIENCQIQSATLENMTDGQEVRRTLLNQSTLNLLRTNGIPIWEVSRLELLAAYGYPALRTRTELRETAHSVLWSMLNTDSPEPHELDAAALGLHVQTERLFLY